MCVSALRHTLTHSHPARIHIYNKQQRVLGNTQRSQRAHYASSPDWTGLCPDDDQVPMEPGMHSHTHTQPPARTMHSHSHVPTTSASVTETTTNTNANGRARCPRHTRTGRRDILFLVLIRIPFSALSGN